MFFIVLFRFKVGFFYGYKVIVDGLEFFWVLFIFKSVDKGLVFVLEF